MGTNRAGVMGTDCCSARACSADPMANPYAVVARGKWRVVDDNEELLGRRCEALSRRARGFSLLRCEHSRITGLEDIAGYPQNSRSLHVQCSAGVFDAGQDAVQGYVNGLNSCR